MEILEAFVLNDVKHSINILWDDDRPLFRASEIGNVLGVKNVFSSIHSFNENHKVIRIRSSPGGPQETAFLTEKGVYKFLMHSRKKEAEVFQEWVADILVSIRKTGKFEIEREVQKVRNEYETKFQYEAKQTKKQIRSLQSKTIIQSFKDKYVVYFAFVHDIDDKLFVIKIGSTKDIINRSQTLLQKFGTFDVFQVYECPTNEMFEKFLHNHSLISKYKHVYNNSTETFQVTLEEIDDILQIASHNKFKFSSKVEYNDILELEKIKLKQAELKVEELKLKKSMQIEDVEDQNDRDNIYLDPVILNTNERRHTQTRGDKIQRYSSDGKTLLKTYESYAFAIRDSEIPYATRSALKQAIRNNSIYKGFRWAELERNLSDETIQILDETSNLVPSRKGFVAMLNLDKNKIVDVFPDQKAASENRKFKGCAAICAAIKRESISGGHYFKMWFDCSKDLQEQYLQHHQMPEKRKVAGHQNVYQVHPVSGLDLKFFSSIEDVIKEFKISRQTLRNASQYNIICKGYRWRFV
jgi:prophage antirepressor-like protein